MFITLVEKAEGELNEYLGILFARTNDGTRGSVQVFRPNGSQTTHHNVPLEQHAFQDPDGKLQTHIKETPPAKITSPTSSSSTVTVNTGGTTDEQQSY